MKALFLAIMGATLIAFCYQASADGNVKNANARQTAGEQQLVATNTQQWSNNFQQIANQHLSPESKQPTPQPMEMPAGAVRVQPAQIIDPNGFGRPMIAATMMTPVGWKTQGGIVWQQNTSGCGPNAPHFYWTATAPDGLGMISILPDEKWQGFRANIQVPMPQTQCPNVWITDVKQFVLSYIQRYRPNARVLDYREHQQLTQELQQNLQQIQANMPSINGMNEQQWGGVGFALIGYQVNGREVREQIGTGAIFSLSRIPDGLSGGTFDTLQIYTLPGFAMRMPKGQLNFQQVEMLRKSSKPNAQWNAKMTQYRTKMTGITADGVRDRSEIISQTGREISNMQMDAWRNQQASSNRSQRERIEAIQGIETYNNPYNGGTVQLDNSYANAWQLNDGTYVLTNDPNFNPNTINGLSGQRLEPTP